MRVPKIITTFVIILLAVILIPGTRGQDKTNLKVFAPVSAEQRPRLAKRFKLFMLYQRNKQYGKLFDLFPKVHTQHPEITKEGFLAEIQRYGKSHIVDFIPAYTQENESLDGQYKVVGCAKEIEKGRTNWWRASIFVSLEDNEWYLSDFVFHWFGFQQRTPARCTKNGKIKE